MPRNASGVYSLPDAPVVTLTTITSSDENTTRNDISTELTSSLDRSGRGAMLAELRIVDGVIATPGLAFGSDVNTGIYRVSNDVWAAVCGGVEVIRFNTVTSAVNWIDAFPSVTTAHPYLAPNGSDANLNLIITGKGTGRGMFGNQTTARLLGRTTAGFGNSEEISLGQGLKFAGTVLNVADTLQTLTDAATIAWDANLGQMASVTLTLSGHTVGAPTNLVDGDEYTLFVFQDATGGRTVSWNAVFKWPLGIVPVLSTAGSATDMFIFKNRSGNLYGSLLKGMA